MPRYLSALLPVLLCAGFSSHAWGASRPRFLVALDPRNQTKGALLIQHALMDELRMTEGAAVLTPDKPSREEQMARRDRSLADAILQNARKAFDSFELDTAARDYQRAMLKLEHTAEFSPEMHSLKEAYAMLGATHLLMNQQKKARDSLERLFTIDLNYAPDPAVFNPDMLAAAEAQREAVRSRPRRAVKVATEPPGAAVLFDGEFRGLSPVTIPDATPGVHYIYADAPEYFGSGQEAHVGADDNGPVSLVLQRSTEAPETQNLVTGAIDSAGAETAAYVAKLAQLYNASEVFLFYEASNAYTLTRHDRNGEAKGPAKTEAGKLEDLPTAKLFARRLLGIAAAEAPPPSPLGSSNDQAGKSDDEGTFSNDPTKNRAIWALYTGSAIAAGVGAVFGVRAMNEASKVGRQVTRSDGTIDYALTHDQLESRDLRKTARRYALIADISYAAAVACLAGGIFVHLHANESPSDSQTAWVAPTADYLPAAAGPATVALGLAGKF